MKDRNHQIRFFSKIRGHDFRSHSGQWQGPFSREDQGHVDTALVSISESHLLETWRRENKQGGLEEADITPIFGPRSGSVFVDAYMLRHYECENFPCYSTDQRVSFPGLTHELSKICRGHSVEKRGRGIIQDVALNAIGGWVILFNEGKDFRFGGRLHFDLRVILERAQENKSRSPSLDVSIYRLCLNHQHPEEYVLIFSDSRCFVKLHAEFRDPMVSLLKTWGEKSRKNFNINFTSSSSSSIQDQRPLNAIYYSNRGILFLARRDEKLALDYLREASALDPDNSQIQYKHFLGIIAYRQTLGEHQRPQNTIQNHRSAPVRRHRPAPLRPEEQDGASFFQEEYKWMLEVQDVGVAELERRLRVLQQRYEDEDERLDLSSPLSEWSYEMATTPHESLHIEREAPERQRGPIVHELNGPERQAQELNPNTVVEVEGTGVVTSPVNTQGSERPSVENELE